MPTPPSTSETPWWKTAVAYQIYPRSFCDASGDGVGDLEGIRRHLDHLAWLGVDAIWLSPFFTSPMYDYGYDVADYCDVDPLFGDLATFDALVADAHALGIRVLIDWVPNHTSIEHPWFVESRSSRDNPKRDWFVWRDAKPDGSLPNNWTESLTFGPAWTLDDTTGQYYLHNFLPQQPDLNWANPEVKAAMMDTLRFWLDRGVDGFRMDVVHMIGKDPDLGDDPDEFVGLPHDMLNLRPETHEHLRDIRVLLDSYEGDRVAIGEVALLDLDDMASHYGEDDELHLCFNFPVIFSQWDASQLRSIVNATYRTLGARNAWPTWVLSNHDFPRHRTRYGGSEGRARAAAVLLLTLQGTPFMYAGEELGLEDAIVPEDRKHDPANRDGCRAPVPWTAATPHGWSGDAEPWLPWPPLPEHNNPEVLAVDPTSILHLYRSILTLRRETPALRLGELELLTTPPGTLGYRRGSGPDAVTVLVNFTDGHIPVEGSGAILLSTARDPEAVASYDGTLLPDEAVVIR